VPPNIEKSFQIWVMFAKDVWQNIVAESVTVMLVIL